MIIYGLKRLMFDYFFPLDRLTRMWPGAPVARIDKSNGGDISDTIDNYWAVIDHTLMIVVFFIGSFMILLRMFKIQRDKERIEPLRIRSLY